MWLHEVRVSDIRTLWLVTTSDRPSAELADLYRHRPDVETDIRDVKRTPLKRKELRGRSVDAVLKELSAGWWRTTWWCRCAGWPPERAWRRARSASRARGAERRWCC
ncbi:hypothetical protein R5W24_004546 [Gemmata sp. JC717]|uniref:hypothetical protein n=1 Tax=Gemmata algarum TaxID=2975278 RepID=UPI0021BAB750|nr:hypothetical protein [Gemmata algarum]MDY3555403.1 hypothetical protein [Gemmata algarum]